MKVLKLVNDTIKSVIPPTCVVCGGVIVGSYKIDMWGQPFHTHHDAQMCASCGRVVTSDDTHLPYNRHICSYCVRAVVRKPEHIKWVYDRVQIIFKSKGLELPTNIPVEIVDAARMAQLNKSKIIDINKLGLTVSGGIGVFGAKMYHNVYMLDSLHKVIFGGVLAHELLHVWQNEHHIRLPKSYSEGFCNLGSYLLYRSIENDMTKMLINNMLNNPDPIYGDGFRDVKALFESEAKENLNRTIEILVNRT